MYEAGRLVARHLVPSHAQLDEKPDCQRKTRHELIEELAELS